MDYYLDLTGDVLRKIISSLTIILTFLITVSIIGCGEDESIEIQSVDPPNGTTISIDSSITVTFNLSPENLTVSHGEVTHNEETVTITGPFSLGKLELELNWDGGNRRIIYTVETDADIPVGMELIPEGEFQLGSVSGEAGSVQQIGNTVNINAFYIDKYEVTNAQYKEFVDANPDWNKDNISQRFHDGNYLVNWTDNSFPNGKADHPVIYVSWYGASAYAQWVNKRLPTEAEWEKAARGGLEGQRYPWGNTIDDSKVNYSLNVGITGSTTPVGDYPPNGYELYDMIGNVLEWCLDEYDKDYYNDPQNDNPFSGNGSIEEVATNYKSINSSRSLRGGSWVESGQPRITITYRRGNDPANTSHLTGFRCAKSVK